MGIPRPRKDRETPPLTPSGLVRARAPKVFIQIRPSDRELIDRSRAAWQLSQADLIRRCLDFCKMHGMKELRGRFVLYSEMEEGK